VIKRTHGQLFKQKFKFLVNILNKIITFLVNILNKIITFLVNISNRDNNIFSQHFKER
jgi:hypothetical protein